MATVNSSSEAQIPPSAALLQSLPWAVALLGLTWAGAQWPLPLPPGQREGVVVALLLVYFVFRSRRPWNLLVLAALAWALGALWRLVGPVHHIEWISLMTGVAGVSALVWAWRRPASSAFWSFSLGLLWLVYTITWAYGWWQGRFPTWHGFLGLATFTLLTVEGFRSILHAKPSTSAVAVGDVYLSLNVLAWLIWTLWH